MVTAQWHGTRARIVIQSLIVIFYSSTVGAFNRALQLAQHPRQRKPIELGGAPLDLQPRHAVAIGLMPEQYAAFGVRRLLAVEIERINPSRAGQRHIGNAAVGEVTPKPPLQSEAGKLRRTKRNIANVPKPQSSIILGSSNGLVLDHGEFP